MDLWFSEFHTPHVKLSIQVKEHLYHAKSEFQQIDVFDTPEFGRMLTLDGFMMLTEKDEFIYHEMIVHPAFATNPSIKRVLVIGAGDGGTIRELVKYSTVEHIDLVEIDGMVLEVSQQFLPQTACALNDERVHIHIEDGLPFVRRKHNQYDLIIVDSTDPFGPGENLFTREFYGNCYHALTENGILINQHESAFYAQDREAMESAHARIAKVFPISKIYQFHLPTYPSGYWLFGYASKGIDPVADIQADVWQQFAVSTKYYNLELHQGAFALPTYIKERLYEITT
ncbi:MAG: polyamine aminopropyltransferase [Aerococcaceae bacterium]|nr:polyamine aminopropyltransferase [Aerococcaceae bacterium]